VSKESGPHTLGKTREASDPIEEWGIVKVRIHSHWFDIAAPMLPTCFPIFGSRLHSSRSKGCVRKIEITRVTSPQFSRYMVQEFLFGRGKSELNRVSKSLSVSQCQEGLLPNEQDGTSEIAFLLPAIWMGVRGHVRCIFRCNARACMRFSAIYERRDPRRATQPIDGELLPNSVIRFLVSDSQIPSMTNHKMSRPAISKSEFEDASSRVFECYYLVAYLFWPLPPEHCRDTF
jgi:hypothetical protein